MQILRGKISSVQYTSPLFVWGEKNPKQQNPKVFSRGSYLHIIQGAKVLSVKPKYFS